MFDLFWTMYRWYPKAHQSIRHSFLCVLKDWLRGIMSDMRKSSKKKALNAREHIPDEGYIFEIQCKYPPDRVPCRKWECMCMSWNTENGKRSTKQGEKTARMTYVVIQAGQWGMTNTAATWVKRLDSRKYYFIPTPPKSVKKRLHNGEINANDYDKLEFVTERLKRLYVSYMKKLERVYGNTNCDDMEVWESLYPECQGRQLFRVGSSDPHFLLTGTTSSIASIQDARQSHELQKVQVELEKERESRQNIEVCFEQFE
ncbi:hypothetical protein Hanom_Chr05g00409791 [Helianthus anomalus]